ncbi:MAG: response regulator [Gammaproteobacteria bacterium]|nr:response regulator [Gammaproteobacteria bacterium]
MTNKEDQLLQELRGTLGKMELSLDAIDDGIAWLDGTGIIQWSNGQFSELVKRSSIEILGQPIQALLSLKNKNEAIDWSILLNNVSKYSRPSLFELEGNKAIKFLEVSVRNFHTVRKDINIVVVLHDVTEKQLNEEAIRETNDELQLVNLELAKSDLIKSKLAAIVESTDDAIIGRTLDGIIESWNKGAEQLYGYKAEEVLGKLVSFIYPPNRQEEFYHSTEQVKNGKPFKLLDTERMHKDGHVIPVSIMMSPIKNEKGEIIGSCSIARDNTELKNMLNMKNDFISIVSHELRTPLTSIQGSLSLLVAGAAGNLPEKAQKLLSIGKQNSERLIRLINDILDIQKMESGSIEFHREPMNIGNLIQEALLVNQAYAEQFNIKIKLIQESSAPVNVDRDRILQVLTNLLSNAIKFSSGDEIKIRIFEHHKNIRVEISNKGARIPEEFHSRIFQKFSQASSSSNRTKAGTGLGLSISKEIIEKHEGEIGFISEPHSETIFYFELPIYTKPFQAGKFFSKIPTVLICENDESLAHYLKMIFEQNDIKAIIINSVHEIKKVIAEQHIDALLLDLIMPKTNEINLIKELKDLTPQVSIIVLSVITQSGEKQLNGNAIPILDWLEKPIDLSRLLEAVQSLKKQAEVNAPNILHVEDNEDLSQIIASLLQNEANMYSVTNVKEAKETLEKNCYDLVILDLMLPDGTGIELLPIISNKNIPVLVFSAYELPQNYASYAVKTLIKSQTSPNEFVQNIKKILIKKSYLDHSKD